MRKWETARFVELATRILDQLTPARIVVLTGAPSEREAADGLCRRSAQCDASISLAGKTSLRELLTLYTLANVLVTNDSGPGHFASLTPVHAVVLFGPETPRLFGSAGAGDDGDLEGAGVQSVRQRLQSPPVALPQQRLHAGDHGR